MTFHDNMLDQQGGVIGKKLFVDPDSREDSDSPRWPIVNIGKKFEEVQREVHAALTGG